MIYRFKIWKEFPYYPILFENKALGNILRRFYALLTFNVSYCLITFAKFWDFSNRFVYVWVCVFVCLFATKGETV